MFCLFWDLPVLYFGLLLYWTFRKSQVWEERTKFAKFLFGLRWSLLALYVLSLAGFYLAQLILEAKGLMWLSWYSRRAMCLLALSPFIIALLLPTPPSGKVLMKKSFLVLVLGPFIAFSIFTLSVGGSADPVSDYSYQGSYVVLREGYLQSEHLTYRHKLNQFVMEKKIVKTVYFDRKP